MADSNDFIHSWTRATASALLDSTTPAEYMAKVYSSENQLYRELKDKGHDPESGLQREKEDLGDNHFLSSQERFNECKEALKSKHLAYFTADLSNIGFLRRFGHLLEQNDAEMTFANMTNVWDHVILNGRNLKDSLPVVPFHPQAVILHSSQGFNHPGEVDTVREGTPKRGLQQYMDSAQQAYTTWRGH